MKKLAKADIPGRNGWSVEFFNPFIYMNGADFLDAIEESRIKGEVFGSMNATIIFLIPKKDKQDTYNDFRPISTCNLIYKVISKVITNMMKPIMDKYIFEEQFGFLSNRQILDAIGIVPKEIPNR